MLFVMALETEKKITGCEKKKMDDWKRWIWFARFFFFVLTE